MSLARLENELIKVKGELGKVKNVNTSFDKVMSEMKILKDRAAANPETRQQISNEIKNNEIINLFSSIEEDLEQLRTQMSSQTLRKEELLDFIESIRTKKSIMFNETTKAIDFAEKTAEELESTHISIRPEFIGTVDMSGMALQLKLEKTGPSVIVSKERLGETLTYLLAKKGLRNMILDYGNARITFKSSVDVVLEAESGTIRDLTKTI